MKVSRLLLAILWLCSCGERSVEEEATQAKAVDSVASIATDNAADQQAIPFVDRPFDPEDVALLDALPPLPTKPPTPYASSFRAYEGYESPTSFTNGGILLFGNYCK